MDPSPKAWLSLVHGSIPIIKSGPLDDAYSQLPAALVKDWDDGCISITKLQSWRDDFIEYFDNPALRQETLQRLTLDYWWAVIFRKWQEHALKVNGCDSPGKLGHLRR